MQYSRAASLFFGTPLALLPSKMEEIRAFWSVKLQGGELAWEERLEPFAASYYALSDLQAGLMAARETPAPGGGNVAVLPLHGVMAQRMNLMAAMSGGVSTEMFGAELRAAVNDPDVSAVVIDADSPGGSAFGMTELADVMYAARGRKPIVAQVDSLAASAAYWAISQADEIVVTPGGELGHIGVSALHMDFSQKAEMEGVKPYLITAGKFKHEQAQGAQFLPPSDEALADWQARVDEVYGRFVAAVARGRGVKASAVRNGFGEGRVVGAQEAVKLGMADRIGTLEQTLARLSGNGGRKAKGTAALMRAIREEDALREPQDERITDEDSPHPNPLPEGEGTDGEQAAGEEAAAQELEEGARRLAQLRYRELKDRAALAGAPAGG